jgi:hypothetical protein
MARMGDAETHHARRPRSPSTTPPPGHGDNDHLRHSVLLLPRVDRTARRAVLLRAGQSPFEPRLVTVPDGVQTERATPKRRWAAAWRALRRTPGPSLARHRSCEEVSSSREAAMCDRYARNRERVRYADGPPRAASSRVAMAGAQLSRQIHQRSGSIRLGNGDACVAFGPDVVGGDVGSRTSDEPVRALVAGEGVVARSALHRVVAEAARHGVVAGSADEQV